MNFPEHAACKLHNDRRTDYKLLLRSSTARIAKNNTNTSNRVTDRTSARTRRRKNPATLDSNSRWRCFVVCVVFIGDEEVADSDASTHSDDDGDEGRSSNTATRVRHLVLSLLCRLRVGLCHRPGVSLSQLNDFASSVLRPRHCASTGI